MAPMDTLVRCTSCNEPPPPLHSLRRGRCPSCYEAWVKARPVGVGASCAGCENKRLVQLRHFELNTRGNAVGSRWLILCHNCVSAAEALKPAPRSVEGLRMRLQRDRRWGDRRGAAVGVVGEPPASGERREDARRVDERGMLDVTDLVEEVIEMEADYEDFSDLANLEDKLVPLEDITGIHYRI